LSPYIQELSHVFVTNIDNIFTKQVN